MSGRNTFASALTFLEKRKLITGRNKVEFTPNLRLPQQVREGAMTKVGHVLVRTPTPARLVCFFIFLKWKALLSVLGALAFIRLAHNAYVGAVLLMGWIEYLCILTVIWIAYLLIRRALD